MFDYRVHMPHCKLPVVIYLFILHLYIVIIWMSGHKTSFSYKKLLKSKAISCRTNIKIFEGEIRSVVTFAVKHWVEKQLGNTYHASTIEAV